jgi:hypothetical protein
VAVSLGEAKGQQVPHRRNVPVRHLSGVPFEQEHIGKADHRRHDRAAATITASIDRHLKARTATCDIALPELKATKLPRLLGRDGTVVGGVDRMLVGVPSAVQIATAIQQGPELPRLDRRWPTRPLSQHSPQHRLGAVWLALAEEQLPEPDGDLQGDCELVELQGLHVNGDRRLRSTPAKHIDEHDGRAVRSRESDRAGVTVQGLSLAVTRSV